MVKHVSKIEPPISLCFSPPLAYCHNHVKNMLLLRVTNLQWLTHSSEVKAKPVDMALGISMIWFQLTFQVFISHYSPPILFTLSKLSPLGVLPRLCFCSCHPHLHTSDPPSGPSVSAATFPKSCSLWGVLSAILPQHLVHLCTCLQVLKDCLISSPELSGTKILFIFYIPNRTWQYPAPSSYK